VQHAYGDSEAESVESVYRPDGTGGMILSDQIVRKEWVGSGGEEHSREEVFATAVAGQAGTSEPQLHQQIDTVRTARADGSTRTTREVREQRGGRSVVIERTTERERPDGRGGTVIDRETKYRDVNGRLRPVGANRTGLSGSS
jgi:hypothetical protein